GHAPMPSPQYQGRPSPFVPASAGLERKIRTRSTQIVPLVHSVTRQRAFRDGYRSRPNVYRQYFPQALRQWADMGTTPRTLSDAEIKGVRRYEPRRAIQPKNWPAIRDFVVDATLTVAPNSVGNPLSYISVIVRYLDEGHRVMGI